MGKGTISYKKLPAKKNIYGDKDFFIRPLNMGLKETFLGLIVRPCIDKSKDGRRFEIEGEFSIGLENLKEAKKEHRGKEVQFVCFESELNLFEEEERNEVLAFCGRVL